MKTAFLLLFVLAPLAADGEAPMVVTQVAAASDVSRKVRLPATILPYEEATLVSHVTGYVGEVTVRPGARVKRGDVLARIDVPLMEEDRARARALEQAARARVVAEQANVAAAEAGAEQHRAALQAVEAELDLRRDQDERARKLHDQGAATTEEVEEARGALRMAEGRLAEEHAALTAAQASSAAAAARVGEAEAALAVATAEVERLEALAAYAEIRCPFDEALVAGRLVDTGALVLADETPLLHVMDVRRVRVQIDADERDALYVEAGSEVVLTPDAITAPPRTAKVTRVTGALDSATRTMRIEIDLDNTGRLLRPGMFLHADLSVFRRSGVITVPARCLRFDAESSYVFLVRDGKLERSAVTTGVDDGIVVEIASGVRAGDEVVLTAFDSMRAGMPVRTKGSSQR